MGKLILLPLLFLLPALAGAGHSGVEAAWALEARAANFSDRVAYLPGNWRLKQEARQFARQSRRLARQAGASRSPWRMAVTLDRLNAEFYDLRRATANAWVGKPQRKRLNRQLRKLSRALTRAEDAFWKRARFARDRSDYGYRRGRFADEDRSGRTGRRYRD